VFPSAVDLLRRVRHSETPHPGGYLGTGLNILTTNLPP
jgi:hypothetical protein